MNTIAVTAFKGGVGKTTVTANLGIALAEMGVPVTLIDLEPSANLTLLFGLGSDDVGLSSVELLRGEASLDEVAVEITPPDHPRWKQSASVRLVPSKAGLQDVSNELISKPRGEDALGRALKNAGDVPGFVIVDCQPSGTYLTLNGIVAAENVLVPVLVHQQVSIDGLAQVADLVAGLDEFGIPANIFGVLRTHVRHTDKAYKENIEQLLDLEPLLETEISRTQEFENQQNRQIPFYYAKPDAIESSQYRKLATEILDRFQQTGVTNG